MQLVHRTTRVGWLALLACAALLLVSTGASSSYAQSAGSPTKSTGTIEGEDGTNVGDPDVPTGETPPPTGSSGSSSYGGEGTANRGHAMVGGVEAVPAKRLGMWAHWKIALKLLARNLPYIR
jgi:hypothetical protein